MIPHLHRIVLGFLTPTLIILPGVALHAAPLVNLQLLGRVSGSGNPFSSTVTVHPGDSVDYEAVAYLNPIGTSNTNGGTTRTIASTTASAAQNGGDGINNLKFNLYEAAGQAITADIGLPTLNTNDHGLSWAAITGAAVGTQVARGGGAHDVTNVRPGLSTAVFWGADQAHQAIPIFGTLTLISVTTGTSTVNASFSLPVPVSTSLIVGGHINQGQPMGGPSGSQPFVGNQTNVDQMISYSPLTLQAVVPEPSAAICWLVLCLCAGGLLWLSAKCARPGLGGVAD